jgi:hypothetical protein
MTGLLPPSQKCLEFLQLWRYTAINFVMALAMIWVASNSVITAVSGAPECFSQLIIRLKSRSDEDGSCLSWAKRNGASGLGSIPSAAAAKVIAQSKCLLRKRAIATSVWRCADAFLLVSMSLRCTLIDGGLPPTSRSFSNSRGSRICRRPRQHHRPRQQRT